MKDSAPRFATPLDTPRPRGAHLFEAFSPKLGRRVRLFNRANFNQWIRLEADPSVLFQCERPARLGIDCDARLIDFWVRRDGLEELLVLAHSEAEQAVPDQFGGVALRVIAPAELSAANIWVTNWQRMLPVINATRTLFPKSLAKSIVAFVREPIALACIEHQFSIGEPPLVRGVIFDLLRTGRLCAPALHTRPLSLQTLLEPVSRTADEWHPNWIRLCGRRSTPVHCPTGSSQRSLPVDKRSSCMRPMPH